MSGPDIPVRCECGAVGGSLQVRGLAVHGVCYCRDCQAFARFLGRPERMLDAQAGTEVIGTLPARLQFTSGQQHLACITLTPRGPLRWYARCCRMAIANGSRFGPSSFAFAVDAASAPVAKQRVGFVLAMPKILWNLLFAKLSGSWRTNPFFKVGTEEPLRAPEALSKEQRYALRGDSPAS